MNFDDFVKNDTPSFNDFMMQGYAYKKNESAFEYVDEFIRYTCNEKTKTHIQYLGCRRLSPKEEIKYMYNGKRYVYELAMSDIYLVEYSFKYGSNDTILKYHTYLPYLSPGNIIKFSGVNLVIMPLLSNKVISIGDNIIFVNINTAKYNFYRYLHGISVDNIIQRVPIITAQLYKNQSKKLENTTKAYTILIHYLLGHYGFTELCKLYLGFVPIVSYGPINKEGYVSIKSTGMIPHGYIKDRGPYNPSNIVFSVKESDYNENVSYFLGNIIYLLDNFPDVITIDYLDNTLMWKKLLGEIIHSGNHRLNYIMEKMNAHFKDVNSLLDPVTRSKLKSIGREVNTTMELIYIIFQNYNNWIMTNNVKSFYYNKSYETETYILNAITSNILRAILDISKEELRINSQELDVKDVTKIFNKYITKKLIFLLRRNKLLVTSLEYSGDSLYPKNTALIVEQEANPINVDKEGNSPIEKKKLHGSMITIGTLLGLPKKNPIPIVRLNPYVNVDYATGTILPDKDHNDIIDKTSVLLNNIISADDVANDVLDDIELNEDNDESISNDDDDYDDNDDNDSME